MSTQSAPLLTYAAEILQSYSRLIVYSGDILRSLPEPREGLSTANIKPKKDESVAFFREWQHLESIFDEYLIRLNDIRSRAYEELEASRVRCLVGQDIDLNLPEAASMLRTRLAGFKKQYDMLQRAVNGGSGEETEDIDLETEPVSDNLTLETKEETTVPSTEVKIETESSSMVVDKEPIVASEVDLSIPNAPADTVEFKTDTSDAELPTAAAAAEVEAAITAEAKATEATTSAEAESVEAAAETAAEVTTVVREDTDPEITTERIESISSSDVDDDQEMEDIFQ